MKLLSDHKLTQDQFEAVQLVESILNSVDFKGWFLKTRFAEMGNFEGSTNNHLYQKFLLNTEYRFSIDLLPKPILSMFSKSTGPSVVAGKISIYKSVYDKMSTADRAGFISHQVMHMIGFSHGSKKCMDKNRSIPYLVGDYVKAASELMLK